MVTGPLHAIASLYKIIEKHDELKDRVVKSKNKVLDKWKELVRKYNQPLLCTYLEGKVKTKENNIVFYNPRSDIAGSVICHLGEIYSDEVKITERIIVEKS